MVKFWKVLLSLFLFTLVFNLGKESAFAAETESVNQNPCVTDFSSYKKQKSKIIKSETGNTVYEIQNFKQAAEELNVPLNQDGEELIGLAYSYTKQPEVLEPTVSASGVYLKITSTGEACGQEIIRSSYYKGPSTATMSISQGISASFSANVSVDSEVVSSGVGFSVTDTFTVTDSYSVNVPSGYTYNIKARPIYLVKNYDIWNDPFIGWDYQLGSGYAMKPVGVCFALYK